MSKYVHILLLFSMLAVTWQQSEAKPFFLLQKSFYVLPPSAQSYAPASTTASAPAQASYVYNAAPEQQQLISSFITAKFGLLSSFLALKGGFSAPATTTTTTTTPSPPEVDTDFTPTEPRKEYTTSTTSTTSTTTTTTETNEVEKTQGNGYEYAPTTEGTVPNITYLPPNKESTPVAPPQNVYLPPHRLRY